jgi:hypothetical protein
VTRLANEGNGKWSRASLSIGGDALRPDQISSTLGLAPTRSGVKGERSSSRHSVAKRTSFWLLTCPLSYSLPPAKHLTWLLDQLEPKLNLIRSIAEEWNVTLFCSFSSENGQGGVTIDPSLLRRLANFGIPFVLDLHPPGPPAEEAFKFRD